MGACGTGSVVAGIELLIFRFKSLSLLKIVIVDVQRVQFIIIPKLTVN